MFSVYRYLVYKMYVWVLVSQLYCCPSNTAFHIRSLFCIPLVRNVLLSTGIDNKQ